jgi:ankyrin repeat protein
MNRIRRIDCDADRHASAEPCAGDAHARAFLRLGADVNVRHRGDGDTPLIRAARMGHMALVRVLLAARASVRTETTSGATALSEAIRGGHDEVVTLLRPAGADNGDVPVERPSIDK